MLTIDIMVDLETLGLGTLPPIIQVTAVAFDMYSGKELGIFNKFISLQSNEDVGAKSDADTVAWWASQSEEAKNMVLVRSAKSKLSVKEVLSNLTTFLNKLTSSHLANSLRIWGNGILFDNRILIEHFNNLEMPVPWDYKEDADLRTLIDITDRFTGFNAKSTVFKGVKHNAINDCRHQIKIARACMEALKK